MAFARASSDDGVASDVVGVVVVDHGSRRAASNEQLERFAALYATATGRASCGRLDRDRDRAQVGGQTDD